MKTGTQSIKDMRVAWKRQELDNLKARYHWLQNEVRIADYQIRQAEKDYIFLMRESFL